MNYGNLTQVGFELRFFWRDLNHGLEMAWSDPSHSSFRFPYDFLRRAHRAFAGLFTCMFTKRVWRRARG
jgi:hypothetical protein